MSHIRTNVVQGLADFRDKDDIILIQRKTEYLKTLHSVGSYNPDPH